MRLQTEMEIASVKFTRKNVGASQGPLAMYLMLKGDVSADSLIDLFPTVSSYEQEIHDRWGADDELRHQLIKELPLEIKGTGVRFEIVPQFGEKLVYQTADVDRVTVTLKAGRRVDLAFRVLVNPTDAQIMPTVQKLNNVMQIDVWSRQAELDLSNQEGDEAERRKQQEAKGKDPEAKPAKASKAAKEPEGESLVPGQKPPQRPKARKPATAGVH